MSASPSTPADPTDLSAYDRAPLDDLSEVPAYLEDPDDPGAGYDDEALEQGGQAHGSDPMRDLRDPTRPALRPLHSFADIVDLVGERRDAKLKVHLDEHVSLVKCDTAAGQIEIYLLAGAPAALPNELREKLNAWTGRKWMVAVSKAPGERPLGDARRAAARAELEQLKQHPAVAAVLASFPGAEVKEVRVLRRASAITAAPPASGSDLPGETATG